MTLLRAVDRLVDQIAHWTPSRWAASSAAPRVHALVQLLADLDAEVEGLPRRPVPRLDNDLALPDQLRVVAHDLVRAGADEALLASAAAEVDAVRRAVLP
ncbi:MAG TPA: hypothetical protein VF054_03115 [Micromonosporaceae bacterium]